MNEHGFRSRSVRQKSKAWATDIHRLTKNESRSRDFSRIDQLQRSAVREPSNLAEGDERKADQDSIRFFHLAPSALAELATQLEIARDVGDFTTDQVEFWINEGAELGRMSGARVRARNSPTPRASHPKPGTIYENGTTKELSV